MVSLFLCWAEMFIKYRQVHFCFLRPFPFYNLFQPAWWLVLPIQATKLLSSSWKQIHHRAESPDATDSWVKGLSQRLPPPTPSIPKPSPKPGSSKHTSAAPPRNLAAWSVWNQSACTSVVMARYTVHVITRKHNVTCAWVCLPHTTLCSR